MWPPRRGPGTDKGTRKGNSNTGRTSVSNNISTSVHQSRQVRHTDDVSGGGRGCGRGGRSVPRHSFYVTVKRVLEDGVGNRGSDRRGRFHCGAGWVERSLQHLVMPESKKTRKKNKYEGGCHPDAAGSTFGQIGVNLSTKVIGVLILK